MAKKKAVAEEIAVVRTPAEVYNDHNDATAQDWPAEKQCQCDDCKAFRG